MADAISYQHKNKSATLTGQISKHADKRLHSLCKPSGNILDNAGTQHTAKEQSCFQIQAVAQGFSLPHIGLSGPAQNPTYSLCWVLTAVVLIRIVFAVILPITLWVLLADAESIAALVCVIFADNC